MNTRNVDPQEIARFEMLAGRWWDPDGEFRPLHLLNPVRARFVAERGAPLAGARVLDVGCGGGLLCEALARAGARVTGIDLSPGMIEVAALHAAESGLAIDYRRASSAELVADWGVRMLSTRSSLYEPLNYNYGAAWPFLSGWVSAALFGHGFVQAGSNGFEVAPTETAIGGKAFK